MANAFKKPGLQVAPLSRDTLQERVYRNLVELILDGSIVPGETVTLHSLSDAFGVSHMPVREALRRLMAANALTVISGRSIGIPKLTRDRLVDLRDVRREIEATAASWAAERRLDSDIEAIGPLLHKLEEANAEGDVRAYMRSNYAFHFAIYRAANSPNLLKIIEDLWLQISPYFNLLHDSGNYTSANEHHRTMFEALRKRRPDEMRVALRNDIDAAYSVLEKLL